MRELFFACALTLIFLATPLNHAHAYLDPGTASILLQGIIGGVAAVAATGAIYWQRVKFAFRRLTGRLGSENQGS
jgi:hypothetical protein